jgi:hypothetical protein
MSKDARLPTLRHSHNSSHLLADGLTSRQYSKALGTLIGPRR